MAKRSSKKALGELQGQPDPKAALDWQQLLAAAAPVLRMLQDDLRARAKASPAVTAALKARHEAEVERKRTADGWLAWQDNLVAQVAAAWFLSCVFVRTLEDRGLLGHGRLAGPGAADSLRLFLELAPSLNERDYLLTVFRELTRFPATRELFDARHNPVWLLGPSAEAAKALVQLFQQPRADVPAFRFGQSDTGFLGWLYQDLDEDVRERFALLQTPRFVESFILDRTLEPAIEKFGLDDTTLIDPTCGSGHFLLGAFERLFDHRLRLEPGLGVREAARKALDAVYGADINPYAVAIARFRLTLAFFERAGFEKLAHAPALPLHVVVADSLLHNPHADQGSLGDLPGVATVEWQGEAFALEDEAEAQAVLHRKFAAVVGNPPYITVKDAVLRERYRAMYPRSASGKYSVAAPFTERFFQLGRAGARVGMITANSFMKREFGKKLIEHYLRSVNLDLVINTSGAYIPGHGTPTVLLFGSSEPPCGNDVQTVLASRGEPSTPADPEQGLVWRSIAQHWCESGYENDHISVTKAERAVLSKHPWSLGGGGAAELKETLEERGEKTLDGVVEDIGFASFTGLDDAFILPREAATTLGLEDDILRPLITGEDIRDWSTGGSNVVIAPYNKKTQEPISAGSESRWGRLLWRYRTHLRNITSFGGRTRSEEGQNWWEWYRWQPERYKARHRITFAAVATHNHFALEHGGHAFSQSAPVIVLPDEADDDDFYALVSYLNSSTAGFWIKQVCHRKTNHTDDRPETFEPGTMYHDFSARALRPLPLPPASARTALIDIGREMETLAQTERRLSDVASKALLRAVNGGVDAALNELCAGRQSLRDRRVAVQEDLDWIVYTAFGLCPAKCSTRLAIREFAPELRSYLKPDSAPGVSPADSEIWAARRSACEESRDVRILENPEYKRRWISMGRGSFGLQARSEMETVVDIVWELLVDICGEHLLTSAAPVGLNSLVADFGSSPELAAAAGADHSAEVARRMDGLSVAFSAAHRFAESGMERYAEWEHTWDLQRREDAGEKIESISVPPKYAPGDYRSATYWQLRGRLDVPKERFISYPGCESDNDGEPVYGWAGWDHEQRAKALATLYWNRKTEESWSKERLTPMLAGLLELVPWLKQWHHTPSDDYGGDSSANYYAGFLDAECRALGLTHDDLRAWRPAAKTRTKNPKKSKATAATPAESGDVAPSKDAVRKPRAKKQKEPAEETAK